MKYLVAIASGCGFFTVSAYGQQQGGDLRYLSEDAKNEDTKNLVSLKTTMLSEMNEAILNRH